ncbi:glycosyltransferase [Gordonia alkanivorans]|uniref:glycosyltransferase n=1 Tax=Gordonia alkanivorans TaxID=84096 RepID=UPI003B00F893
MKVSTEISEGIGDSAAILSILILNWNGHDDTSRLLKDLSAKISEGRARGVTVLVLDNGSDTPPPDWWSALPYVRVEISGENLGYSGGMSRLCGIAETDYVWLLNNDVTLAPGALRAALDVIAERPTNVHLPMVLNPDGSVQSRDCFWNPVLGWRTSSGVPQVDAASYSLFGDIFVAPLFPRALIVDLSLLPAMFHTYGEDIDACYAVAASGRRVVRAPSIRLEHRKSSSKPKESLTSYQFECRGIRNIATSCILNYEYKSYWAIPLVVAKMMLTEGLWRRRNLLIRCPQAWVSWAKIPPQAVLLALRLRRVRAVRKSARRISDRDIRSLRTEKYDSVG